MKKALVAVILLASLTGCSPHSYRSDTGGYTLYRSRMMTPESPEQRMYAPQDVPGSSLDWDDRSGGPPDLFDAYSTFRP